MASKIVYHSAMNSFYFSFNDLMRISNIKVNLAQGTLRGMDVIEEWLGEFAQGTGTMETEIIAGNVVKVDITDETIALQFKLTFGV
jgi:hypothetical protein